MSARLSVVTAVTTSVERIRYAEDRATRAEGKAIEWQSEAIEWKYEAARLIADELDRTSARALGREIGKSHVHVLRMAGVHRRHGDKPPVRTLEQWNRLYHEGARAAAPRRSPNVWTRARYLEHVVVTVKAAARRCGPLRAARVVIKTLGADVVRRALDPDVPDDDVPSPDVPTGAVEPWEQPSLFGDAP